MANIIENFKNDSIPKKILSQFFIITLNVEDNNSTGSPNFVLEGKNLDN
jgi:hypothetical protein